MQSKHKSLQLAPSASALGAGLLGFGIGAKWGNVVTDYAFLVIIAGVFIHVFGMYIMQMKDVTAKTTGIAKALWISAWICLLALIAIIIYLFLGKK
jgi:hypothetical protein